MVDERGRKPGDQKESPIKCILAHIFETHTAVACAALKVYFKLFSPYSFLLKYN